MSSVQQQLKALKLGDLVEVQWCDASVGKSLSSGSAIDVPVKSWGIFIGLLGEKTKHIVIAQNSFRYADGIFDLDYTAIPLSWTCNIAVLIKEYVPGQVANCLLNSFLWTGRRSINHQRTFQQRLSVDGGPD